MEHACPGCNSPVDDNSPFCPTCDAAQVRATEKEYSRPQVSVAVDGNPGFLNTGQLRKPRAAVHAHAELRSAFYASIVGAILSMVQPGAGFVLALPLGGVVSVLLYRRLSSGIEPSPRTGFRLGALSGLFVFGLLMVLIAAGTLARHNEGELHEQVVKIVQQAQARNPDPQARQAFEYFLTPQGMTFMMIVGFIFLCVLFVLLSGVGGAVSASLLRRKAPPGQ
ncbi:MAG TPA: zinc ribbon domain-containing protein [Terriglobales bacterium]|nr:zinc ribbon domain-containing protein [Terriglobales bacterium]